LIGINLLYCFARSFSLLVMRIEDAMKRELEDRTQGSREPLTHFIRVINEYYERFCPKVSEVDRVNRMIKNMHPEYRQRILSTSVVYTSVKQLMLDAYKAQA
jgi:hypothetical protein